MARRIYFTEIKDKYRYRLDIEFKIKTSIKRNLIIHKYFELKKNGELLVKEDYAWDGATGVLSILQTRDFVVPSMVHDVFCQAISEGRLNRKYRREADKILYELCLSEGMPKFRAWYVYHAVRLFVRIKYR